jgi:Flp pilus assembly protein TadG
MTRRHPGHLLADTAGSTALEFGLATIPLFLLILGIVESGLLFWNWQALQSAAIDAGRCAALNAPSCGNPVTSTAGTQAYAVQAAAARGITIKTSNVTVLTGTSAQAGCGNTTATVLTISINYKFAMIGFVPLPSNLSASVCYPLAS